MEKNYCDGQSNKLLAESEKWKKSMQHRQLDQELAKEKTKLMTILAKLVTSTATAAQKYENGKRTRLPRTPHATFVPTSTSTSTPCLPDPLAMTSSPDDPNRKTSAISALKRLVAEKTPSQFDVGRKNRQMNHVTSSTLWRPPPAQPQKQSLETTGPDFLCRYCRMKCSNPGELFHHVRRVHRKPFKCRSCGVRFSSSTYLKNHEESYHPGQIMADTAAAPTAEAASFKSVKPKNLNSTSEVQPTQDTFEKNHHLPATSGESDDEIQFLYKTPAASSSSSHSVTSRPATGCRQLGASRSCSGASLSIVSTKCQCTNCQKFHEAFPQFHDMKSQNYPSTVQQQQQQHRNGSPHANLTISSASLSNGGTIIEGLSQRVDDPSAAAVATARKDTEATNNFFFNEILVPLFSPTIASHHDPHFD